MPRYYFDLYLDQSLILDTVGTELPDASAAQQEATNLLSEAMTYQPSSAADRTASIGVRDSQDRTVMHGTLKLEMRTP